MNVEVTIDEPEIDIEVEEEEPEKTVCARLILTKKQKYLIKKYNQDGLFNRYFGYFIKYKYFKMDSAMLNLSVTADMSDKEIEELKPNFDFKEVDAHLILTDKQKNDLHEAFNLLDYSGEGKIKAEDFRVAIKALGYEPTKEELQNMINGVDNGQSGKLSFENFETAIMRKIMALDSDGDIMKSFRLFDVDDTGLISFENVKHVCEILGDNLTDEEIEEMIDDADKDFDGYISVQEFMRMIKNSVNIVTP